MKKFVALDRHVISSFILSFILLVTLPACEKYDEEEIAKTDFNMVNLVASTSQYNARVDANLVNGWGMAFTPSGNVWIAANGSGYGAVYNGSGGAVGDAVAIPSATTAGGGTPTGIAYNTSSDFVLQGDKPATFIFVSNDGVISAWSNGVAATRIVDRSSGSAYTGVAIANDNGDNFIYAVDFKSGKIDVFDKNFTMTGGRSFSDASIPPGFVPFNIQNIKDKLYVTYVKQDSGGDDIETGTGLGYVNIFNPDGTLEKRFTSQGQLNAPWGIALAPLGFFDNVNHNIILIGNLGDGHVNAYSIDGNFLATLQSKGVPVEIKGMCGMCFSPTSTRRLFFTGGPNEGNDGVFGYFEKR